MWFKQSDLIGKVNPDLSGKFYSDTGVHFERRMHAIKIITEFHDFLYFDIKNCCK